MALLVLVPGLLTCGGDEVKGLCGRTAACPVWECGHLGILPGCREALASWQNGPASPQPLGCQESRVSDHSATLAEYLTECPRPGRRTSFSWARRGQPG